MFFFFLVFSVKYEPTADYPRDLISKTHDGPVPVGEILVKEIPLSAPCFSMHFVF